MTRVLLSGFDPFDGARVNPSWEVAELLADEGIGLPDVEVVAVRLPVVFSRVRGLLAEALERYAPDVAIGLGLAAGRPHVSVERVGINLAVARIPDNEGDRPRDVPLALGRPDAHLATLPVGELLAGDPRLLDSLSAGAYVCNAVLFHLLDLVALATPGTDRVRTAGFLHVPATGPDALASHDEVRAGGAGGRGAGAARGTEGAGADVPQVPLREVADVVAGAVRLTLQTCAASAASGQPDG